MFEVTNEKKIHISRLSLKAPNITLTFSTILPLSSVDEKKSLSTTFVKLYENTSQ